MIVQEIVNGSLLAHTLNKSVALIGLVTNVHASGMSFEMKTPDNVIVTVNLTTPVDDILNGYVQVFGTCQSKSTIKGDSYIRFTPEQSEGFDSDGYNKLCALYQKISDIYKIC